MAAALIFPGQGSQAVGMGHALFASVPAARAVFEEVDAALGEPLSRLIFEGPDERLRLTENAQPALMATSIAALRALEAASGRTVEQLCRFVAGHSLGEYSALAAAGSLSIGDAARLLRLRGQAMQAAVPVGEGAMAAVLGLDLAEVEAIAAEASKAGVCEVGNDNAPGQAVVSGARAAVERAVEIAKAQGRPQHDAAGERAVPLPTDGAGRRRAARRARRDRAARAGGAGGDQRDRRAGARSDEPRGSSGQAGHRPGALAREPGGAGRPRHRDDRRARLAPGPLGPGQADPRGRRDEALGAPEEIDAYVATLPPRMLAKAPGAVRRAAAG